MSSRHSLHTLLHSFRPRLLARSISSTPRVESIGWFDKIKGIFTDKSTTASKSSSSFSLNEFANQLDKARMLGSFRKFEVGHSSATMSESFKKNTAILRYLGSIDPTGENLQPSHKHDATKHCNCTIADVEHVLARYTWAKEAQKKMDKLKEEGKPLPKTFNEVQKLMGSTPFDVGKSNLAKSGETSRNAFCPCGSGKRYKRCCGMT